MTVAWFHFHQDFSPFLAKDHKEGAFRYTFGIGQSVKHLIEAFGVPHTELHHILVNGKPVNTSYQVKDEDYIEIFPFSDPGGYPSLFFSLDMQEEMCTHCFILDNHLGKLASYLRLLGFDSLYRNDYQDDELAQVSRDESRILLTRDQRLLMRNSVLRGYWVRSKLPHQQIKEIIRRFDLIEAILPFRRCAKCNSILEPISKEDILYRLEPLTRRYFDEFHICPTCEQIYWKGSHYFKIMGFIDEIKNVSDNYIS